jgi:tetratricopeptide (TPR) repeat protein
MARRRRDRAGTLLAKSPAMRASGPVTTALLSLLLGCAPSRHAHPRAFDEVTRGYGYLDAGDLERAGIAFSHALAFNPALPEALNGAALVERRSGRLEAARLLLEEAIRGWPEFAEGHSNLGEVLLALGHPDQAAEELQAALRVDPDMVAPRLNLARASLHRGRTSPQERRALFAQARRTYLHLLEAHPELAEAHHDLAFMDYLEGAYSRAAAGYRRAAELAPGYVEALHGACISLVRAARCAEATGWCQRCLATAPGTSACLQSLEGAQACAEEELRAAPSGGGAATAEATAAHDHP